MMWIVDESGEYGGVRRLAGVFNLGALAAGAEESHFRDTGASNAE